MVPFCSIDALKKAISVPRHPFSLPSVFLSAAWNGLQRQHNHLQKHCCFNCHAFQMWLSQESSRKTGAGQGQGTMQWLASPSGQTLQWNMLPECRLFHTLTHTLYTVPNLHCLGRPGPPPASNQHFKMSDSEIFSWRHKSDSKAPLSLCDLKAKEHLSLSRQS